MKCLLYIKFAEKVFCNFFDFFLMYLYLITSDLKDETKYTLPLLEQCIDADYGVFDFVGDSCQAYRENTGNCGKYDHGYFKAKSMCCACKGKIQCNHSTEKLNSFSILTPLNQS